MFDVLITAAIIAGVGWIGFEMGKRAGREEAEAELHGRRHGRR